MILCTSHVWFKRDVVVFCTHVEYILHPHRRHPPVFPQRSWIERSWHYFVGASSKNSIYTPCPYSTVICRHVHKTDIYSSESWQNCVLSAFDDTMCQSRATYNGSRSSDHTIHVPHLLTIKIDRWYMTDVKILICSCMPTWFALLISCLLDKSTWTCDLKGICSKQQLFRILCCSSWSHCMYNCPWSCTMPMASGIVVCLCVRYVYVHV